MLKKLLIFGLVAAVGGGIYGYKEWNRKAESMATRKPDATLAATDLATQYSDAVHLGKVIQVSGKLASSIVENGKTSLTLETGDPLTAVVCELDSTVQISSVSTGNNVVLRGQCDGKLTDVQLSRCVFIK